MILDNIENIKYLSNSVANLEFLYLNLALTLANYENFLY